ncbi:hypothetical protein J5N97_007651 [Dioscorea zingiberensis]|uniref:Transmembrane protein n=1 Tax=Dioscorea zingiberensis TaxID=325984 RepID=A0A9D5HTV9_9LILI|nr:hypothetical protein J5N97_007651 [Dioscorea zingiberensis]
MFYPVSLPANFSGIEASVVRLRNAQFWSHGVNASNIISIPPRTKTVPHVRRLVLVFVHFGNLSSSYYDLPSHVLATPVVGLSAYDATNISADTRTMTEIELSATGTPISIVFPQVALPVEMDSKMECVVFSRNGSVNFSNTSASMSMCTATSTGRFSIAVSSVFSRPPIVVMEEEKGKKWSCWVVVSVIGVIGLGLLCTLVGIVVYRITKIGKMKEMEMKAENSETLESVWIGGSKIPSASLRRTQPIIENETAP